MVFPFSCCNGREQTFKFQYWSLRHDCAHVQMYRVFMGTHANGDWEVSGESEENPSSSESIPLSHTRKQNDRVNIDIRLLPITACVIIGENRSFYHHRKGTPRPIEWAGVINRVSQPMAFKKKNAQQPRQKTGREERAGWIGYKPLLGAIFFVLVMCIRFGLKLLGLIFLCNWHTLAITDVLSLTTHTNLDHVEQSHSL